jgi:hypothetical protein
MIGGKTLDEIKITLRSEHGSNLDIWIDVIDNSLSRKWLQELNSLLKNNNHLEKNYCWVGWTESKRNAEYLCEQINKSIAAINASALDYKIDCEPYTIQNTIKDNLDVEHEKMNWLHRYFEDLQGWSGGISNYYNQADSTTRWHIRQLNLLCHEYESLVLSMRKLIQAPEWRRPSQLMCWLNAPRFVLDPEDYELFGIETINRSLGGVYVGVNKAVGKHHWEVFSDEGRDSRINELITTGLRTQTEATGDFDIEWARDPGAYEWQIRQLGEFRDWLKVNGFDPDDKSLTIGHPKIAQVDLLRSFGTTDYNKIWSQIAQHLDVYKIQTSTAEAVFDYRWSDENYMQLQIDSLKSTHNDKH